LLQLSWLCPGQAVSQALSCPSKASGSLQTWAVPPPFPHFIFFSEVEHESNRNCTGTAEMFSGESATTNSSSELQLFFWKKKIEMTSNKNHSFVRLAE